MLPAALAGISTAWIASALPFYPAGWPLGLAIASAALGSGCAAGGPRTSRSPVAVLPLGNISLGLGIVYAVVAVAWLALSWNDARSGLLAATGPLLALVGGLGLVPLTGQLARGRFRGAAQGCAAVLVAAVVAGFRHVPLPFGGSATPRGLGIAGSNRPGAVAYAIAHTLLDHRALLCGALVIGAASAALPFVRRRGPWWAVAYAASFMGAIVLVAPAVAVIPLIGAAWLTAAVLALEPPN